MAITWACDRFHHYLLGLFYIETDHKTLVPLMSSMIFPGYDFSVRELDALPCVPVKDSQPLTCNHIQSGVH
jgi:hypothetical protein